MVNSRNTQRICSFKYLFPWWILVSWETFSRLFFLSKSSFKKSWKNYLLLSCWLEQDAAKIFLPTVGKTALVKYPLTKFLPMVSLGWLGTWIKSNQIKRESFVACVLYERRRKLLQIEEKQNIAFSGRKAPRRDDKQTDCYWQNKILKGE